MSDWLVTLNAPFFFTLFMNIDQVRDVGTKTQYVTTLIELLLIFLYFWKNAK